MTLLSLGLKMIRNKIPRKNHVQRVLFLCAETFPPIYAFLREVFNKALRESGYRFIWIMPSTETYAIKEMTWDGNPVILFPKIWPEGVMDIIPAYRRHLYWLSKASQFALRRFGPFNMVQVRDDPAMAYIAWRLKKKLKVPFVYQISHLKEEEIMMYAQMRIYGNPLKNLLQGWVGFHIRNFFLKKADLVFPISDQMKKTLATYGVPSSRMVVLPEGVDASINPCSYDREASHIRECLGLKGKKVIVYVGTMNRFRQLDFLLEVFTLVSQEHPETRLLMVGAGKIPEDLEWLQAKASKLGVQQKVIFTGKVPRESVPAYIRASDVGVSPFIPNRVLVNNSPIKLLEYLALEVPAVATDIPEQKRIIVESGAGICVPWDVKRFANAVNTVLNLTFAGRRALGRRGRGWVRKNRDFSVLSQIALRVYHGL